MMPYDKIRFIKKLTLNKVCAEMSLLYIYSSKNASLCFYYILNVFVEFSIEKQYNKIICVYILM